MIFRRVADLVPGDAVRPFDEELWRVGSIKERAELRQMGRVMVTFSHPMVGMMEVECAPSDMVRLA